MESYRYRAYLLKEDGSILLAIDLFCPDDDTARARAGQLVDGHDVELWHAERKITRLSSRTQPASVDGLSSRCSDDPGSPAA